MTIIGEKHDAFIPSFEIRKEFPIDYWWNPFSGAAWALFANAGGYVGSADATVSDAEGRSDVTGNLTGQFVRIGLEVDFCGEANDAFDLGFSSGIVKGWQSFRWTLDGREDRKETDGGGVLAGVFLRFHVSQRVRVVLEGHIYIRDFYHAVKDSTAAIEFSTSRRTRLRAGWWWMDVWTTNDRTGSSGDYLTEMRFDVSGGTLGLTVVF